MEEWGAGFTKVRHASNRAGRNPFRAAFCWLGGNLAPPGSSTLPGDVSHAEKPRLQLGWWKTRCTAAARRRRVGPAADSNAAIRSAHEPETAEAPGQKNSPACVRTPAGNPATCCPAHGASFSRCKSAAFPAQTTGSEAVAGGGEASRQRVFARPAAADFGNPGRSQPGSESLPKTARQARPDGLGRCCPSRRHGGGSGRSRPCGGSCSPSSGAEGENSGRDSGGAGGIARGNVEKGGICSAYEPG